MSEFPHGWSTRVIEEICDIHDYRRIPLSSEERRERKGPYPYYGANNIQDRIDDFIFDFDAVLIAEDGGYYGEHEYRDIAQYATGKYWVNNHAHILTGKPGLDTRFLYYALVRKNICPWINTGTRSKLNQSDLKQIELLVPPLPEQKKIAEILSGIDHTIERAQSTIARIYNAIQGVRDKTQSGEGEIAKIGDLIARISTGVSVNGENRPCRASENGILKVSCVSKGIFFPSENKVIEGDSRERATMSIKKGMLLMSRANTPELVGACGITTTDHDNLFLPDKIWNLEIAPSMACEKNWLNNALNSQIARSRIRDASTGTSDSMRNISQSNFCEIEILVPPMRIQQEQANLIDSLQNKREAIANKLARYLMVKNALAQDLLSGRKRVSI